MKFFDSLRRALVHEPAAHVPPTDEAGRELRAAWGLDNERAAAPPEAHPEGFTDASLYDRTQWRKKLALILSELPDSRLRWDELIAEAKSMSFDPAWVTQCQVEEFMLLIRRAVADRRFTEQEHQTLDLARDLIGIPEAEAEAALQTVITEAQQFFGKPVSNV